MNVLVHLGNAMLDEAVVGLLKPIMERPRRILKWSDDNTETFNIDIILVNSHTVRSEKLSDYPFCPKLLMDTGLSSDEILALMAMYKLGGIISSKTDSALFIKALNAVVAGEVWISRDMVRAMLDNDGFRMEAYPPKPLSKREREVVNYVCKGCSNKEVASALSLSERTVKVHLNKIFRKVNVTSRARLIAATASK